MINRNFSQLTLDEVVFEQRNQAYGAYELRQIYNYHLLKSVCIMFLGVGVLAMMPMVINYFKTGTIQSPTIPKLVIDDIPFRLMEINTTPQIIPVIEKKSIAKPFTPENLTYKPVDKVIEKTIETQTSMQSRIVDPNTIETPSTLISGTGTVETPIENSIPTEDIAFKFVEGKMPKLENMNAFLNKNLNFPSVMSAKGLSGKVVVSFVVGKNGKIREIKIARSSGYDAFDDEALRVVNLMPEWQPGVHNNQPVSVFHLLPISFKLNTDN